MARIKFTDQQNDAIEAVESSVIVSAAAGSGKTAVLAARCAHLVCGAPEPFRCRVDELLVLTFTDASAAEMRNRIIGKIRDRVASDSSFRAFGRQVALVGAAHISTIHSFCLWLIRRSFQRIGVDPAATVMDDSEAVLMKHDVMDALVDSLYRHALGDIDESGHAISGHDFTRLVDTYGQGSDWSICQFAMKTFEFATSLPNPDEWLDAACAGPSDDPEGIVAGMIHALAEEIQLQIEDCERRVSRLGSGGEAGHYHADLIGKYLHELYSWHSQIMPLLSRHRADGAHRALLQSFEPIRQVMGEYKYPRANPPSIKNAPDDDKRTRAVAVKLHTEVKDKLWQDRIRRKYLLFTMNQRVDDVTAIAPFIRTLVSLVRAFRDAYDAAKRKANTMDFADLERLAFRVLTEAEDPSRPSDDARALQRRFAHILVDEFQDINPLQEAIIRSVSRESVHDKPNNLFVVGDIKQSIYRFRLAEPEIFANRQRRFSLDESGDQHLPLNKNFRSRPEVLEATNLIFEQLMPDGAGTVVYDKDAVLVHGREEKGSPRQVPVEVHLLDKPPRGQSHDLSDQELENDGNEEPEEPVEVMPTRLDDPESWSTVEREACLIGRMIRKWVDDRDTRTLGRPIEYRDIVILLRAHKVNAEQISAMLGAHGIPAFAETSGSLFDTTEVRDVMAVLQVLDNPRQDIPLASVLRNGVIAERLTEDDLVRAGRSSDRRVPFHETIYRFAEQVDSGPTHDRLSAALTRIDKLRRLARRRPLSEVLSAIFDCHNYLGYVSGLPHGQQRRANLLKFHDLTRAFGSFKKQGLHRFLRFVERLGEANHQVAAASLVGAGENVVRIMSIHKSKGLEFPIVFVAGLGTRLNIRDRSGSMILERKGRIGLRMVDNAKLIEYPTVVHMRVADEIDRASREEELRILYVAMTRAEEKLILVGTRDKILERMEELRRARESAPDDFRDVSSFQLKTARSPLEWLLPALGAIRGDKIDLGDGTEDGRTIHLRAHAWSNIVKWSPAGHRDRGNAGIGEKVAALQPLPADEPVVNDASKAEEVLQRVDFRYPQLGVTSIRSAMGATEMKGLMEAAREEGQREHHSDFAAFDATPARPELAFDLGDGDNTAEGRGTLTHRVLEHLDLGITPDEASVAQAARDMVSAGILREEDLAGIDAGAIAWFLGTPLADQLRSPDQTYHREFRYISAESPAFFDSSLSSMDDDTVLIRGIIDGVLVGPHGVTIIDFKTDHIGAEAVPGRAAQYEPQMRAYMRAAAGLFHRPVQGSRLVFLTPRQIVDVDNIQLAGL
ncbi:MAG: helicase-exonuclease AddAB subunit AddA [Planctomycetota bacterium]|jgi:ATP-dependent helicase/nuclease subunit A